MPSVKPITFIIPAKNRVEFLKTAIASVLNQTINCQVFVVDDGSSPPLSTALGSIPGNVSIIRNNSSLGPAQARNHGLKMVHTPYVAFLDSDDYLDPEFAKTSIGYLTAHPHLIGTTCLTHRVYEKGFKLGSLLKIIPFNLLRDVLLIICRFLGRVPKSAPFLCLITPMVFKTKEINRLSFDPEFRFCEDWMFIFQVLKRGNIGIINKRLAYYRYSPASFTFEEYRKNRKYEQKSYYYLKLIRNLTAQYPRSLLLQLFRLYTQLFLIKGA